MGRRAVAAAVAAACAVAAGCGGEAPKPPAADPPEAVFRKFQDAYVARDAVAQFALMSTRARQEAEEALVKFKADPATLARIAEHLHTTPEALKPLGAVEFSRVVMTERLKDPVVERRYRGFGVPSITQDGRRLRCSAKSPDGGLEWLVYLVEEEKAWRVDEEEEIEYEVRTPGK